MQCLPAYSWQRLVLALSFLRALAQRAERERRRTIREKEGGKEEDGRRILAQSENERYSGSSPASQPALEKRETVIRKMRGGEWWRVRRKKGEKERKEKYIRKRAQRRRAVQYMSSSLGSPKVAYLSSSGFFASRARASFVFFASCASRSASRSVYPSWALNQARALSPPRASHPSCCVPPTKANIWSLATKNSPRRPSSSGISPFVLRPSHFCVYSAVSPLNAIYSPAMTLGSANMN